MTTHMSEQEMYELARKRVRERRDFYTHLTVYIVVNVILIIIWALSGRGYKWFLWPLCIWGAGVVFNFLGVFVWSRDAASEKRAVEKEVEKMKRG